MSTMCLILPLKSVGLQYLALAEPWFCLYTDTKRQIIKIYKQNIKEQIHSTKKFLLFEFLKIAMQILSKYLILKRPL